MLRNLEDEDVELMIESTFSTIIQRWESFDVGTRTRAETILKYLINERGRLVRNAIVNLPSLSQFPELADVEAQLNTHRTPTNPGNAFQIFSRRISHENSGVVLQALVELKAYLKLQQSFLQASAVSDQPDLVIGLLVRAVLDACMKFSQSHPNIAQLSAECIGLIGCLDPNRVESIREQREMVVVSNFDDPTETRDFILFLLEEIIVKAFVSATDTGVQGFLSYVMQQLLVICEADIHCVPGKEKDKNAPIYQKWMALPPSVQDTLTPFLTSKYSVAQSTKKPEFEFPIFRPETMRPEKLYSNWLKSFTMVLLYRPKNINAGLVFEPLQRAVRIRDSSVATFLLPYVVLHVIVDGEDQNRQEIGEELLRILKYEIPTNSRIKREDLKTCSEVR
jgi:serine/threonine-protein kinase ATR